MTDPLERPDRYLRVPEAAAYLTRRGLPIAPATLDKLRCIGGGPEFRRYGRRILYAPAALDAWAAERLSRPLLSTSDAA